MDKNVQTIQQFYTAFQKLDYATMNSCYSDDIVFSDPVFGLLNAQEVKVMWQMLCTRAKEFNLTFSNISTTDDEYYTTQWQATYIFTVTGNKVVNNIKAYMRLQDGKIIEHSDAFNLHKWASQALGFKGWLFGYTRFFQNQISKKAKKGLQQFIDKQQAV